MSNFLIWDVASMAWTEIGLDDSEYITHAKHLKETYRDWNHIEKVIRYDICGSFSIASLSMILIVIPLVGLFLVAPMPDWGYDEEYLRNKMVYWESKPKWFHYMNPFRIIGYPLALFFVFRLKKKLKKEFHAKENT